MRKTSRSQSLRVRPISLPWAEDSEPRLGQRMNDGQPTDMYQHPLHLRFYELVGTQTTVRVQVQRSVPRSRCPPQDGRGRSLFPVKRPIGLSGANAVGPQNRK